VAAAAAAAAVKAAAAAAAAAAAVDPAVVWRTMTLRATTAAASNSVKTIRSPERNKRKRLQPDVDGDDVDDVLDNDGDDDDDE